MLEIELFETFYCFSEYLTLRTTKKMHTSNIYHTILSSSQCTERLVELSIAATQSGSHADLLSPADEVHAVWRLGPARREVATFEGKAVSQSRSSEANCDPLDSPHSWPAESRPRLKVG